MCCINLRLLNPVNALGKYAALVGKRVDVRYRAENISHQVKGRLSADSGSSIFIEDRFSQEGREKTIRVEVPYEFILRVLELPAEEQPSA